MNRVIVSSHDIKQAPETFQLFPFGETMTDDGPILVDEESMRITISGFKARGNKIVFDYEHQTLYGGEAPAAGAITDLIDKGHDGLWVAVSWTARAKAFIDSGEYFYYSPVSMVRQSDNRLVGLHSVALTNNPATHNIRELAAKVTTPFSEKQTEKENEMKEEEMMVALKKSLDLKVDAVIDDALVEISILKEKASEAETKTTVCKGMFDALGLKESTGESEAVATIHALKNKGDAVSLAEFKALNESLAIRDRDDIVTLALSQGKITPTLKDWAESYALKDPEGFKMYIEKASVVVPQGEQASGDGLGKAENDKFSSGDIPVDEASMKVHRRAIAFQTSNKDASYIDAVEAVTK